MLQTKTLPRPPESKAVAPWKAWVTSPYIKHSLLASLMALMVFVSFARPIDTHSESQIGDAFTRALIGFGLARALNGVISVAQGTEFAVQPAGIGVNFSPGEILDPINDLVERFSWVMLLATSSLGIQKVLLEVSSWIGITFMLGGAALFWLLTRWRTGNAGRLAGIASRVLLAMLLIRFLIPVGALANDWIYKQFLEPRYEMSAGELESAAVEIREISSRSTPQPPSANSLGERARNLVSSVTSRFDFEGMLNDYKRSAENISEHAINLIVVFMLQTIIFPLIFLFIVYKVFRMLISPRRPLPG